MADSWDGLLDIIAADSNQRTKDLTSRDVMSYLERERLVLQYRRTKERTLREISKLKNTANYKMFKARRDFEDDKLRMLQAFAGLGQRNYSTNVTKLTQALNDAEKSFEKGQKLAEFGDQRFLNKLASERSRISADLPPSRITSLLTAPIGAGEQPFNDRTSANFPATFRDYARAMNATGFTYFTINPDTLEIEANEKALRDSANLDANQLEQLATFTNDYNRFNKEQQDGIRDARKVIQDSKSALEKLGDNPTDKQIQDARAQVERNFGPLEAFLDTNLDAVLEAGDKLADTEQLQNEADALQRKISSLEGTTEGTQTINDLAFAIADDRFRQWAADHGYDNLTQIPLDAEGKPDLAAYRPGGDDLVAERAFKKQLERGPRKYGYRSVFSGEIITVQLKNGNRVSGERMNYHAADPPGTLRMVDEEGKILMIPARELEQVTILDRDEEKLDKLAKLGLRRARRRREDYVEATLGAMTGDPEELVGAAFTKDGKYVVDSEGNYIKQEEFDRLADVQVRDQSVGVHVVMDENGDPQQYFFNDESTGKFYEYTANGLVLLDPDKNAEKIAIAQSKPVRRVGVTGEGGSLSALSREDFESILKGEFDKDLDIEVFAQEKRFEKGDDKKFDDAYQARRDAITPEDLGFKSTQDRPDPFRDMQVKGRKVIGGVTFADIDREGQEAELPEKPTEDPTEAEEAELGRKRKAEERLGSTLAEEEEKKPDEDESKFEQAFKEATGQTTTVADEAAKDDFAKAGFESGQPVPKVGGGLYGGDPSDLSAEAIFGGPKREGEIPDIAEKQEKKPDAPAPAAPLSAPPVAAPVTDPEERKKARRRDGLRRAFGNIGDLFKKQQVEIESEDIDDVVAEAGPPSSASPLAPTQNIRPA